ncbi:hypothetical protein AMECASPLE_018832 [Ameca splendens]|uniref:Uncharacterized protein n=1 Tax=Ameca splendens TaxID=208324 RepID=A0ABV0ZZ61_9TELE
MTSAAVASMHKTPLLKKRPAEACLKITAKIQTSQRNAKGSSVGLTPGPSDICCMSSSFPHPFPVSLLLNKHGKNKAHLRKKSELFACHCTIFGGRIVSPHYSKAPCSKVGFSWEHHAVGCITAYGM